MLSVFAFFSNSLQVRPISVISVSTVRLQAVFGRFHFLLPSGVHHFLLKKISLCKPICSLKHKVYKLSYVLTFKECLPMYQYWEKKVLQYSILGPHCNTSDCRCLMRFIMWKKRMKHCIVDQGYSGLNFTSQGPITKPALRTIFGLGYWRELLIERNWSAASQGNCR